MAIYDHVVSIGGVSCQIEAGDTSLFERYRAFALHRDEIGEGSEGGLELISSLVGCHRSAPESEGDRLYGAFGELLPLRHRVIFHGVAVAYEGRGYVFTAASGTGKSTHAFLWRRYLGDAVRILSGDKPVISVDGDDFDGEIRVWGTPWGGKEQIFENGDAPLCGLGLICRDTRNYVERCGAAEFFDVPFQQMFIPGEDPAATLALKVGEALLERVPLYRIHCDMSEDAVRASFEGLTGLDYETHRAR